MKNVNYFKRKKSVENGSSLDRFKAGNNTKPKIDLTWQDIYS